MRVALIALLSAPLGGCLGLYHRAFHHETVVLADRTVDVKTRRVSEAAVPASDDVRATWESRDLLVSWGRKTVEVWEWKRVRERHLREICEGTATWDSIVIPLVVFWPVLLVEYITVVPLFVELALEHGHKAAYRKERVERTDADTPPWTAPEEVQGPVAGAPVAVALVEGGIRFPLADGRTSASGRLRLPLAGLLAGPTRLKAPTIEISAGDLVRRVAVPDGDGLLAVLQGADWSLEETAGDIRLRTEFLADGKNVRFTIVNEGAGQVSRLLLRFGEADYRVGRLAPGEKVERRVTLGEEGGLKVEIRHAGGRLREETIRTEEKR